MIARLFDFMSEKSEKTFSVEIRLEFDLKELFFFNFRKVQLDCILKINGLMVQIVIGITGFLFFCWGIVTILSVCLYI